MINIKTAAQEELLYNRLVKRRKHLQKWARRIGADAFRLYDRDIPEIPLALDLYGDSISGALYKRPYEKDEAEEKLWLAAMKGTISRALDIPEDRIFLKNRERQRGKSQYQRLEKNNCRKNILEAGLRYEVNLSDYLDTGLFLDTRKKRALIRWESKGKRVLNLFSYTSTLSVCAAAGGALEVDSVDMSRTYLEWGAANFRLNGFSASMTDERAFLQNSSPAMAFRQIRADVLSFLHKAALAKSSWDLIVLDPPSFSNSKKMITDLDIRRDYAKLIRNCIELLSPKGTLWFSVNARNFKIDEKEFPHLEIHDMTEDFRDEDFKGKKIPSCWKIETVPKPQCI